jgi:gas vesicle protein
MDYEQDAHSAVFVSGFLLGAMVGAGIALLAAPQAGTRTGGESERRWGRSRLQLETSGTIWPRT